MLKAELEAQNKDLKKEVASLIESLKESSELVIESQKNFNGFVKRNDEEEAVWVAAFNEALLKCLPIPSAIKYAYEKHKKYKETK